MTVHQQLVANQGFLECGRHEPVTRTGMGEDGKVDPEKEEVEDQRDNDETNHSSEEVFGDAFLHYALEMQLVVKNQHAYIVGFPVVQEVPKVDHDSNTDGKDGENPIDFRRPGASHEETSGEHPSPPIECEFAAELFE